MYCCYNDQMRLPRQHKVWVDPTSFCPVTQRWQDLALVQRWPMATTSNNQGANVKLCHRRTNVKSCHRWANVSTLDKRTLRQQLIPTLGQHMAQVGPPGVYCLSYDSLANNHHIKVQIGLIWNPGWYWMYNAIIHLYVYSQLLTQVRRRYDTLIELYKDIDFHLGELELIDAQQWYRNSTAEWWV